MKQMYKCLRLSLHYFFEIFNEKHCVINSTKISNARLLIIMRLIASLNHPGNSILKFSVHELNS